MVSALFVYSLSADLPNVGQISKRSTTNHAERVVSAEFVPRCAGHPISAFGLAANWTGAYSFDLCNGTAIRHLSSAVCRPSWSAPDPLAYALSVVWPLDGFGIYPMDRACVRWNVLPSVSSKAMNVPTDPLNAAFLVPRYWMPLALQTSAWPAFADLPTPVKAGFAQARALRPDESPWQVWEPDQSLDDADRSDRTDMAAMIPRLKKIFIKEGVPQQWVWMAEVESALNPRARSSAGAVGLFQLMPGTARRFGLQTTPLDDRMEPEKSAGAAAQYLKFLRQEFGCWSLALAAYNAGEGRVKEIMKKRKARTFNEVERYLPSETRAYVPKVMAIVALREDQFHGVRSAYWMP